MNLSFFTIKDSRGRESRTLALRSETGRRKYGETMMREDLDVLDWVRHAQEEALDCAVYLERLSLDLARRYDDRQ